MTVSQTYWADWGFRHILWRTSRQESTQIWFARFNLSKFRRMSIKKSNQNKETLQTVRAEPAAACDVTASCHNVTNQNTAISLWRIQDLHGNVVLQICNKTLQTDDHEFCCRLICNCCPKCLQKVNFNYQSKKQIGKLIILYCRQQKQCCQTIVALK